MLPHTLLTGIATMHGSDPLEAPIMPTAPSLAWWEDIVRLSAGASFSREATDTCQAHDVDWAKDPTATSFDGTAPVAWKCLGHEDNPDHSVTATGRLIGGTLDVNGMLPGTGYGDLERFAAALRSEGLLFYLDNCDVNPAQYCRMLHHMRPVGGSATPGRCSSGAQRRRISASSRPGTRCRTPSATCPSRSSTTWTSATCRRS